MTPPFTYSTRNDAFTPSCVWVLEGSALREEREGEPARVWSLADVVEVNLRFVPTRPERNRYRCRLRMRNGRVIEFLNRTYLGLLNFRETNETYVAFVGALHRALALELPGCRFTAGTSGVAYALNVAAMVFVGIVLGVASWFFVSVGLLPIAVLKVILILIYLPTACRWFRRNRPATYAPNRLPSAVLPEVEPPPLPA